VSAFGSSMGTAIRCSTGAAMVGRGRRSGWNVCEGQARGKYSEGFGSAGGKVENTNAGVVFRQVGVLNGCLLRRSVVVRSMTGTCCGVRVSNQGTSVPSIQLPRKPHHRSSSSKSNLDPLIKGRSVPRHSDSPPGRSPKYHLLPRRISHRTENSTPNFCVLLGFALNLPSSPRPSQRA
jgi:hypothetical protein